MFTIVVLVCLGVYIYRVNSHVNNLEHMLSVVTTRLSEIETKIKHGISVPSQAQTEQEARPFERASEPIAPAPWIVEEVINDDPEITKDNAEEIEEIADNDLEASQESDAPPIYSAVDNSVKVHAREKPSLKSVEKDLSTRWMMWIGGIAFALGGVFLVKYSIDSGLLSPAVRLTFATILGLAMVACGEAIRLKHINVNWLDGTPDYMPSAISAAGLFTAFAAIYTAYDYAMIYSFVAFSALAGLSVLSSVLALRQGRFFAYLGIIAGLVIPILVDTGNSDAYRLFPYLIFIIASALWVSRKRGWIDVPAIAVFLGIFWALTWIMTNWQSSDVIPVGGYLLLLGGINTVFLRGDLSARTSDSSLRGLLPNHKIAIVKDLTTLLCVLLFVSIVRLDHYSATAMFMGGLWLIGHAYAVSYSAENDGGGLISVFGALLLLGSWHVPDLFEIQQNFGASDALNLGLMSIAAPGTEKFIITSVILAGTISMGIFLWLPNLLRKTMWASISVLFPITILLINYWRISDLSTSYPFAFVAMALAGVFTYATMRYNRADVSLRNELVATYATGATTAVAFAIAMILREAWLSFALVLEILALGYIWRATAVKGLRTLALIIASIVLVRLFLNASVFDYGDSESLPLINWLFYAYGLTSAIFYYAAKLFAQEERDRLLSVLTAGSILLLISFITLEIHVLSVANGKLSGIPTATEMALQTINWGVATTLLFWLELKHGDKLIGYLRRLMTLSSLVGIIVGGGAANNIFLNPDVGHLTPIINIQFLQYFVPAVLFASKTWLAYNGGRSRSLKYYSGAAFLVMWYWLTAEIHVLSVILEGSGGIFKWNSYNYSTEVALQTINWSVIAGALFWFELKYADKLGDININFMRYFASILSAMAILIGLGHVNNVFVNQDLTNITSIINIQFLQYLIPALLFAAIAWLAYKKDLSRSLKYYGGAAFFMAWYWLTAEVHVLSVMFDGTGGNLWLFPSGLEVALQTINWTALAALLFWMELKYDNNQVNPLRKIMTALSLLAIVLGGGIKNNIFINSGLGDLLPIANIQLLQYFIPAMLIVSMAWLSYKNDLRQSVKYYGGAIFIIIWYWLTAEVHVFATLMDGSKNISDWERYGFSIVWLLYAIAFLVVGLKKNNGNIRMAGLFVLAVVVLKVFVVDMNGLEGLARALSFMGLGTALIGIGYLYQKLNQNDPNDTLQTNTE
ncbi:MAG: DUF2339 domain-containing protein [Emcibacteraceae bacterium]|nr:DUF2339 domain-containing protein [Emcibacteraceae bacterium]